MSDTAEGFHGIIQRLLANVVDYLDTRHVRFLRLGLKSAGGRDY
jgi:hypothetical protein